MILTAISPDKISIGMFKTFVEKGHFKKGRVKILVLNSSFSEEMSKTQIDLVSSRIKEGDILVILLKMRVKEKVDTDSCIKINRLKEVSDFIVSFEVYAVTPYILKDSVNLSEEFLTKWKEFIGNLEKS